MPPTSSAVDGTLAQAVELLAVRAADRRCGLAKRADLDDSLSGIGQALSGLVARGKGFAAAHAPTLPPAVSGFAAANPILAQSLVGAGIGAGMGGVGALTDDRPPGRRRGILGSMLSGGLAGAGIGAGIGAARSGLAGLNAKPRTKAPPGAFTDPRTGRPMLLSPEALKADPGLAARVAATGSGATAPEAAVGSLWSGATGVAGAAPITTTAVAAGGIGDELMNNDRLRLGDRKLFGRRLPGMIDPRHSRVPDHLREGATLAAAKPGDFGFDDHQARLLREAVSDPDGAQFKTMNRTPEGAGAEATYQVTKEVPQPARKERFDTFEPDVNQLGGFKQTPSSSREEWVTPPPQSVTTDHTTRITAEDTRRLRNAGARASAERAGKNTWLGKPSSQPRVQRTLLGHDRELPVGRLSPGRLLPRILAGAGAGMGEVAFWKLVREQGQKRDLRQILTDLEQRKLIRPQPPEKP